MKKNLFRTYLIAGGLCVLSAACTNLDETLYDKVNSSGFLKTKEDVYRSFLRTFEHGYWTVQGATYQMQENSADQVMTPNRQGHWLDGGTYYRLHYHTWTAQDNYTSDGWNNLYKGIAQANNSLEDLKGLDASKFSMNDAELKQLIAELRTMRAWYYLRLFDLYRNIALVTTFKGEITGVPQSTPKETFTFIETELKEAIPDLAAKGDEGTKEFQGRWTKAGAYALLARLYLNAKVYIGEDRFNDCATICQDIINNKYGGYALAMRWDEPFDWNNDKCPETIFAFPGSFGRTHWQYDGGMYWWGAPYDAYKYFGFIDWGRMNPKYALQPGRDVDGNEYSFKLGKPFVKFAKYPDDFRLKVYKNLGNSTREGMFLYGYLVYNNGRDTVESDNGYALYIRDQVGIFNRKVGDKLVSYGPGEVPNDKQSDMTHADQNSGVFLVKYPYYPSDDAHKIESDYVEVRLAEIYYMLAECRFRAGDRAGAAVLLNAVRQRNYPAGSPSLYDAGGSTLTEQELLDEWGREFLGEGRRRTDLIRFGKFNTGTWWDKQPDGDDHTSIFPIGQRVMNVNTSPALKQNPGYN